MYYLYILYSPSSDKYYVGYSSDYIARLEQHNTSGRTTYTSKHRPWELKAAFVVGESESQAINAERFVKKQKSRRLIESMIQGNLPAGNILSTLTKVF